MADRDVAISVRPALWFPGLLAAACIVVQSFVGGWGLALGLAGFVVAITVAMALRSQSELRRRAVEKEEMRGSLDAALGNETQLEDAFGSIGVPCALCSGDGRILLANEAFVRLTGRTALDIVGAALDELGPGLSTEGESEAFGAPVRVSVVSTAQGNKVVMLAPRQEEIAAVADLREGLAEFQRASHSINELAQRMASSSELMSAYADDQAQGAKRQKDQTETVAASMERMMGAVMEVASNATATSEAAGEAQDVAREGVELVHQAVAGINSVAASAKELAQVLGTLDTQAAEVGRIIGVISDIADQTNLLALNAAIEAARAGDAGRGFAVVADEVRKLAEKTMQATQEVEQSITAIQKSSRNAMDSMDRTGKEVEDSTELSNRAGDSLQQVMGRINDMVGRVQHIAQAAEEQSSAAEEISASVEEIADIARDSDEGATQQAYATKDMADLSADLLQLSKELSDSGEDAQERPGAGQGADDTFSGVLPIMLQDHVRRDYGEDTYEAMQEALGDPAYESGLGYPGDDLNNMVETLAVVSGQSGKAILRRFGGYAVASFRDQYPRYFEAPDLKAFLMTMNDVHAETAKTAAGAKPPRFTFEDKGDRLFMNCQSKRGLFDFFEGAIHGAAESYGQSVDVKMSVLADDAARAEIRFL